MDINHLIPMANRIAEFFASQPRSDDQLNGVTEHLRLFWAPQMRQSLIRHVDALASSRAPADAPEMHPLVLQAVQILDR